MPEILGRFFCISNVSFGWANCVIVKRALDYDRITDVLAGDLDAERFLHSLGVVHASVMLAARNGVSVEKAALAALLHDGAKGLSRRELLELAGTTPDWVEERDLYFPGVLHAKIGAMQAFEKYGVDDAEILEAIRYHPTGKADPSMLLQVLVAADYTEPTRDFEGVEEVRAALRRDLRTGLRQAVQMKLGWLTAEGKQIHPAAIEFLNSLK